MRWQLVSRTRQRKQALVGVLQSMRMHTSLQEPAAVPHVALAPPHQQLYPPLSHLAPCVG
jgi:hypothetical protein